MVDVNISRILTKKGAHSPSWPNGLIIINVVINVSSTLLDRNASIILTGYSVY
jgi:hypothetical protein